MLSMTEGLQVLDTKTLGKPATFRGQEEDWAKWCFAFESFSSLLGRNLQQAMEQAANTEADPARLSTYSAEAADLARTSFAILVALCNQGRAVNVSTNVERQSGIAAWRRLKREHEPRRPGRHANMLSGLLAPDWANCEGDTLRERFLQ